MQAQNPVLPRWELQPTPTKVSLRGLCAVSAQVCWATGSKGTVLRTTDGGQTWEKIYLADSDSGELRDVEAFSAQEALVMQAGEGRQSRVFRTLDGGQTWQTVFQHPGPGGFLDGMAFWNHRQGLMAGDPMQGRIEIWLTEDKGQTWQALPAKQAPPVQEGEFSFAASGTHLCTQAPSKAWVSTGGQVARIFYTSDGGQTWQASPVPLLQGKDSQGVFSVSFINLTYGLAAGGDYDTPGEEGPTLAYSRNGGKTWKTRKAPQVGFRSCIRYRPETKEVICVGQGGSSISFDRGRTWFNFGQEGFHTLSIAPDGSSVWAAGTGGRIALLREK
ncbi:MAG: oxidoreductase [Microscillaceae bacterium]